MHGYETCSGLYIRFDIRGFVHHSTIHKAKSNKMQQCIKILLFHIYMKLNMFRAQCAWQCPLTTCPTTFHIWKTRGCQCSFRFLMMGGVSPKTSWASYKYGIINFWYIAASCWIFLYELVSLQYQRKRKSFFSLMIPYAKNIQKIQTNLKQNILVTMWKWV
jgi:hypothetical protein